MQGCHLHTCPHFPLPLSSHGVRIHVPHTLHARRENMVVLPACQAWAAKFPDGLVTDWGERHGDDDKVRVEERGGAWNLQ